MDDKSYTVRVPKRWARIALIVGATALIVAPLTAVATDAFTDVPTGHTHHNDITWLKGAAVTKGCNPPANTQYCPDDNVTRAQMATFMRNLAKYLGAEDGTPAQADHATSADSATTAANAGSADSVVDGAIGTDQIATDAAGVAVAGMSSFGFGANVTTWFNRSGGEPTINPVGTGVYDVTFPGLAGQLGCDAIVELTVLGASGFGTNAACNVSQDSIRVSTFNASGVAADRSYSIVVMTPGGALGASLANSETEEGK